MKRAYLLGFVLVILVLFCLCSCVDYEITHDKDDESNINIEDIQIYDTDVIDIKNFKCEITIGETKEKVILEEEKSKELYNIIKKFDRIATGSGIPSFDLVNTSKDYIYMLFSASEKIKNYDIPTEEIEYYGFYYIYTNDIVGYNLSPYMSSVWCYQFEEGLYDEINSYIRNKLAEKE